MDTVITIAVAALIIAVAALIIAAVMPSTPAASADPPAKPSTTTETQPAPVAEAQLAGLLLSVDEVKQVANVPHNYYAVDATTLHGPEGGFAMEFSLPHCLPAWFGGSEDMYRNGGVAATVVRTFGWLGSESDPLPDDAVNFEERVVLFETPSAAKQQADKIVELWRACAGNTMTSFEGLFAYRLGQVSSAPGNPEVFTLRNRLHDDPANKTHELAIAAKANVVVDVMMSGFDLGDSIEAVTVDILARIPE